MTKKDYIKLIEVFIRPAYVDMAEVQPDKAYLLGFSHGYHGLLKKLIVTLKADNPKFNADKFMQALG